MHLSIKKIFKVILLAIFIFLPIGVYSQSNMSGGSYNLNGGITVFTSQSSGGIYTINPSGDPITGSNSSGGTYTLQPTPYGGNTSTSSSGGGVSGSTGGPTGVGYTSTTSLNSYSQIQPENPNFQDPSNQNTNQPNTDIDFKPSKPVLDAKEIPGVEWIYKDTGIDTDLDGKPDVGSNIYTPSDSNIDKNYENGKNFSSTSASTIGQEEKERELAKLGITFKRFTQSLNYIETILIFLLVLVYLFLPIIRGKNPRKVSYIPLRVIIEYIVALHKGIFLKYVSVRNFDRNVNGLSDKYYFNMHIIDAFILPIIMVLVATYLWTISWALSSLILGLILVRVYIGIRLLTSPSVSV